jgi:hypothetical protein
MRLTLTIAGEQAHARKMAGEAHSRCRDSLAPDPQPVQQNQCVKMALRDFVPKQAVNF